MRTTALFGLIALVPAAFGPTAATTGHLIAALCIGNSQSRSITVPLHPILPGSDTMCCAKGCHSASSRKRTARDNRQP